MKDITDLLGRAMLSFIFLYEAYDSIFYFRETKDKMSFYGLTWNQDMLLVGAIILLLLGGVMLLLGYRTGMATVMLLMYWVPVTFIVHSFWNDPEPARRLQSILFMKNIAIMGGMLMVWANGAGKKYSIKRLFATTRVPGA
ncbi:MAG: DoxX family membrane protein [Phaeodactylibacter sp.]|nr:DoxX family membrane protein [Phaeodactylibacter sp.]MCB9273964.1 DoxX family membrane protein [Lewinellaceae bacterium]